MFGAASPARPDGDALSVSFDHGCADGGDNIKGDAGLKADLRPRVSYFLVPLWFYTADTVKDRDGNGSDWQS